jgi:hypothetical protein
MIDNQDGHVSWGVPVEDHPLVDRVESGVAVSRSQAPVLALTALRADLLVQAAGSGRPLVLQSGDATRLSEPLRSTLVDLGIPWVVETEGGLRDGLTGRPLGSVAEAVTPASGDAVHPDALYLERPTTLQLVVSASVRHRADERLRLGSAAEAVARLVGCPAPAGWSPFEPVDRIWDRAEVTAYARDRMPRDSRVVVVGPTDRLLAGTLTARRTDRGVEEITELVASLGPLADPAAAVRADRIPELLSGLAEAPWPLLALAFVRAGRDDLTTTAFLAPAAGPHALLVGAPAVRDLGIDVALWQDRFGARVVGRPRTPALVVRLRRSGDPMDAGWAPLQEIVDAIGTDRVAELSGLRVAGQGIAPRNRET